MPNPYARERIENWVSDFCSSDRLREAPRATHEHAPAVLAAFLAAACEARDDRPHEIEPDDIEQADIKHALLSHVARLNVPDDAKRDLPALCAAFLGQLQDEGRLSGGRVLGAYARALREAYEQACTGKRTPITRPGAKIGRNDPCPCGSGRKYKQCCMRG